MADIAIVPQQIALAGLLTAYTAVSASADSFYMPNDEKTYLEVINGGASPITVTITGVGACDQGTLHDDVVTVANATTKKIGPFPRYRFNQTSGSFIGNVKITFSASASITYGAFKI